ncbi:hypothetical protein [Rhodovulum iodosum]
MDLPELSFPEKERKHVQSRYDAAEVILEYGSGGSTAYAASRPSKLIFSVESDFDWAIGLQRALDTSALPSQALIYYVDIGATGDWGRPVNASKWTQFYRYPLAVWDEAFFRMPDLVLIDGRFRPGCFVATCLRLTRPATILFDDYVNRKQYHHVERFFKPTRRIGRMAEFEVEPRKYSRDEVSEMVGYFFEASYAQAPAQPVTA